jgi:hypothetical protein
MLKRYQGALMRSLILKTKKPIQHLGLVNYLKKRGIPLEAGPTLTSKNFTFRE